MPLIGMFMNVAEDDREMAGRRDAFLQGLGPVSNLRIAMRFGGADYLSYPMKAGALAKRTPAPDLYFCSCWPTLRALLDVRDPRTPIVFAGVADVTPDPAANYELPNVFGFIDYGANLCAQWPEYLRQIAPSVTRAAVIYDVNDSTQPQRVRDLMFMAIDAAKGNLSLSKIDVRSATLEQDIQDFASSGPRSTAGLIVPALTPVGVARKKIIPSHLPAVYGNRLYAIDGGLISRGTNTPNLYLYAGHYANQILNGTPPPRPIDISQTGKDPNKLPIFETVINLHTANTLGGDILAKAMSMALQADLVIAPDP